MIKLKEISIEGFGSISEPLNFNLDRPGVNLMVAPNGSGKTTIWSALTWCLYQVNLKGLTNEKVQTWTQKRHNDYRGTKVSVTIEDESGVHMIVRHLNFKGKTLGLVGGSKLMLFKYVEEDWKLQGDGLGKAEMATMIEDLLKVDQNTFLNSVLFGQRMARIVSMDNTEKRKLFEKLFDMKFIAEMRKAAQEKESELRSTLDEVERKMEMKNDKIDNLKTSIEEAENLLKSFEDERKRSIIQLETSLDTFKEVKNKEEENIKELSEELIELEKGYVDVSEAEDRVDALRAKAREQADELDKLRTAERKADQQSNSARAKISDLRKAYENIETLCPYCKRDMPKDKVEDSKRKIKIEIAGEEMVVESMDKLLTDYRKDLVLEKAKADKLQKKRTDLERGILEAKEFSDRVNKLTSALQRATYSIESIESNIKTKEEDLTALKNKKPPQVNVQDRKDQVKELFHEVNALEKECEKQSEELNMCSWWVNNALATKGLKSYVFSAMLIQLNAYIKKYGNRLGIIINMGVDMEKANRPFTTTCIKEGFPVDYDELSGGEKTRVDIALAFAMHDLISLTADISVLIMDELFDGLDEQGMEVAFDLIRLKAVNNKSIYVITHTHAADVLNAKAIEVKRDKTKTIIQ